jgi:hypothetical protein
LQGPISIKVGRFSVVEAKKVRVPLLGSPKRLRKYTAISRPQQHSHSREKVLVNCLLQAKRVHVDCRGLESALEAVRVSVEAVRVSIEAFRCFKGLKRSLRMSIEAVRMYSRGQKRPRKCQ